MKVGMILRKFDPKTGKSRHLLEVCRLLANQDVKVSLITGRTVVGSGPCVETLPNVHEIGGNNVTFYLKADRMKRIR